MIIVNINSGLGNQMFQYAFAYSQSKLLNTFFLVEKSGSLPLYKYFNLNVKYRLVLSNNKFIQKVVRRLSKYVKANSFIDFTDCNMSKDHLCIKNNTYYVGYFQSIIFFEENELKVKNQFRIKKQYVNDFQIRFGFEFRYRKILVIHVRRTDYLTHGIDKYLGSDDLSLPINYYRKCLEKIDNLENYKIIVIGDDIEFNQNYFSNLPNVSFEYNELIVDFQLLMNADVAIISNSTFAWWAVYLNEKLNKRVYAPKFFLGFHINKEFPVDVSYKLNYEWITPL